MAISHETTVCALAKDWAMDEDINHRVALMNFFKELVQTYLQELEVWQDKLTHEIIQRTEGNPGFRNLGLDLCRSDQLYRVEKYMIDLGKSNLEYHQRLIAYDTKFADDVSIVPPGMADPSEENMESLIQARHAVRNLTCTRMFRVHLQEMKAIREAVRTEWERRRTSITMATQEPRDLIFTEVPGLSGSRFMSLPVPLEPMWTE